MLAPPLCAWSESFQRYAALLFAGQFIERNRDEFQSETGYENSEPVGMIRNVDRMELALPAVAHRRLKRSRLVFDLSKASGDFPTRIKDSGRVALAGQRRFPREEQWVGRFHCLRGGTSAPTFATRF